MGREGTAGQPLCADIDGFSQHAAVRVEAHERKRFEQLCRYNTRPAQSDERVQVNAARQVEVELKLKTPWRRERGVRAPNANCGAGELKIVAPSCGVSPDAAGMALRAVSARRCRTQDQSRDS